MKIKSQLPEQLIEIAISTFKNKLLKELGSAIISIIFFGSRQRGKFTPDSDIDIFIIVKEKKHRLVGRIFEIADEVERDILSYRFSFSLHIQSQKDFIKFKEMKSPFIKEILKEGEVILAGKTQSQG